MISSHTPFVSEQWFNPLPPRWAGSAAIGWAHFKGADKARFFYPPTLPFLSLQISPQQLRPAARSQPARRAGGRGSEPEKQRT